MRKPKVVIEELTNETNVMIRGHGRRTSLILASFDTRAVRRIRNKRREEYDCKVYDIVCPAKYALTWTHGGDDIRIIAQVLLTHEEHRVSAVWFDDFYDLPVAIEKLHEMFPGEDLPDQVSCLVDWPVNMRNRMYAGDSIVGPQASAKTKD